MQTAKLRIAVADDELEMRDWLQATLSDLGHQVVAVASNGRELVEACLTKDVDMVVTDIKMPEMDGLQAATRIGEVKALPVILVSAYHDEEFIERALADHVLAYLVKPIKQANLHTALALVMRRFQEFQALHAQADSLRQALEDRKLVERAKGILMKRAGLDEPGAFRRLQSLASEKNLKVVDLARSILMAEEALG